MIDYGPAPASWGCDCGSRSVLGRCWNCAGLAPGGWVVVVAQLAPPATAPNPSQWPAIGARYTLTEAELALASRIAMGRYNGNRSRNIADALVSRRNAVENDIDGYGAEIAFCALAGAPLDTGVVVIGKHDTIVDGRSVDVKQTIHAGGMLLVTESSGSQADVFALMIGTAPTFRYAGCCARAAIITPANLRTTAPSGRKLPKPAYAVQQSSLSDAPRY